MLLKNCSSLNSCKNFISNLMSLILHNKLCKIVTELFNMGKRKNRLKDYEELPPEEMYTHVRKNVSIPKYMDLFLYEHNISLSKLVQCAITNRIQEIQTERLEKQVKQSVKQQTARKTIQENQKQNPKFKQELLRARLLLTQYFNAFDKSDYEKTDLKKQLILSDFPEMYVDIIRFEQWEKSNPDYYQTFLAKYENPVERLIAIKQECF